MITPSFSPTATERVLPRLALDFTTASLDPRVTVTRALNTATRINSSGYIETVNANLPRFDYSPTSIGTCRGLLIEEARTNLVLQSSDYTTASWTKTDTTVTAASGTSPDGTNTATLLTQGSAGNAEVWQSFAVGAGNTVTYSRYVKKGNSQWYMLLIRNGGSTSFAYAFFDLTNGVVGTTSTSGGFATITGSSISNAGDGWFRVTFTVMIGASFGTAVFSASVVTANGTATPVNGGTRYEWGSQAEVGTFVTSHIPTTTTSLTRNADAVAMTGSNFTSWFTSGHGTLFTQGSQPVIFAASRPMASLCASANNPRLTNYRQSAGNLQGFAINSAGTANAAGSGVAATANTSNKIVFAYSATDTQTISANASVAGSITGVDMSSSFASFTALSIGTNFLGDTSQWCGHIQKVMWWPQKLTDAEVRSFSK